MQSLRMCSDLLNIILSGSASRTENTAFIVVEPRMAMVTPNWVALVWLHFGYRQLRKYICLQMNSKTMSLL